MTTSEEDIIRGHELYLRHLLLLEKAVPVALKAIIERESNKRGRNLDSLVVEKKDIFNKYYNVEFLQLFQNDEVNANIDLWDTRVLCVVALVLFESDLNSTELEAIACIQDQRKDLDSYAHSASLNYKTFETKWDPLHSALLEIIKDVDDEDRFNCKRMIYCFKSESISVNFELINKLKQTNDVSLHVQMAIQDKTIAETHGEKGGTVTEKENKIPLHYDNPVFTEMLQDTCVFLCEPVILTCRLNVSEKTVTWRHDYNPVEETDTVAVVNKECAHWLAISHAKLADAGHYSCACGSSSTSACLKVSESPLEITKCLHVATAEADVRENMDVVLTCKVNKYTNKAVWRHNGQEIKPCNRRVVSVDNLEHKLTIRNAKFEDEGYYTIDFADDASSVQLTINGNLSLSHKKQLTEELYRNWVRGALGLKYLKVGLERFSDTTVSKHHSDILTRLPTNANTCTNCTEQLLLPSHAKKNCPNKSKCLCSKKPHKRKTCPNGGFCSTFHDHILDDHRFNDPLLKNTDIQKWSSDPWSVATCYISTPGYKGKTSAKDVDCAGLLSIFINNTFFNRSLGDVIIDGKTDLFKQAREARNDILHNANYELSEGQLHDFIDLFIKTLEIRDLNGRSPLSGQRDVQVAIKNLKELRDKQIEVHLSGDLQNEIEKLKQHAMSELAANVQDAMNQSHIKLQQLEERLKKTEEDLQLIRDLGSTQTKSKESTYSTEPFELELYIRVVGPTRETSTEGNQRIYKSMKCYDTRFYINTNAPVHSTDQSVHLLLGYINTIKGCKIVDVLNTNVSVNIKVHCFTCKAIADFLKSINGNEFLKETVVLRKCLEMQEHIKVHDIIVSCSSESMEKSRKRLDKRSVTTNSTCGNHQGTQCTWYCSDHDKFFCSACKDSEHRTCVGLKQVVSERTYGKQNQSLVVKRMIGKYNVRIKNRLINIDDNDGDDCRVSSIRMLPDGNILLVDNNNDKLKKLDSSYNIVSHCDLSYDFYEPFGWFDVCYIGNNRAVVCCVNGRIQYVNVSGNMKLEQVTQLELDYDCTGLACHGVTLYVRSGNTIYTYNTDCQEKHFLYNLQNISPYISYIALSDDGERIYITNGTEGLITIDNKGNHLSTLKSDVWYKTSNVCVAGDGTALVLVNPNSVHQVDYSGKRILGTVVDQSDGLDRSNSLCFDRQRCKLIVTAYGENCISVFKLQHHNSDTNMN